MLGLKEIVNGNRKLVFVYTLIGIILAFLSAYSASYYEILIDHFSNGTVDLKTISLYAGVLILLCILNYIDEYPAQKLSNNLYLDIKLLALKKVSRIDYVEYQKIGTGELIQRIENGANAGKEIVFGFYLRIIRELLPAILFSLFFIFYINPQIAIAILAGYVVVFFVTHLLLRVLYNIKEKVLLDEEKLNHILVRGFMEMPVFRVNCKFREEISCAEKSKREIVSSKTKMQLIHEAFFAIFALLITFLKIAIIIWGYLSEAVSIGEIIALITLVDNAYTPIAIFNVIFVQYKMDKISYKRYSDFLNKKEEELLCKGDSVRSLKGDIILRDVSYVYDKAKVVDNISLKLKEKSKIAFVGESGSGKSTIMKMLMGLIHSNEGKIEFADYDISKVNLESFYKRIGYVSQESPIFDGSLRENLVFNRQVSDDEIYNVLSLIGLNEMLSTMPDKLETQLGERGISLSGGERQRLAIARILLSNVDIIMLDEATSAIDNINEKLVMRQVMKYALKKTLICVVHRLNYVNEFEHIVVFRNGKIVAQGEFTYLLDNCEYFKQLYDAQIAQLDNVK